MRLLVVKQALEQKRRAKTAGAACLDSAAASLERSQEGTDTRPQGEKQDPLVPGFCYEAVVVGVRDGSAYWATLSVSLAGQGLQEARKAAPVH